jgi:hypothetical protein
VADYGGCVIPCLLLVDYGKAEIRCCSWASHPPRGLKRSFSSIAVGHHSPLAFFSVSPQKSVNSKQLASKLPVISYTNPYPRFGVTRQLSLG